MSSSIAIKSNKRKLQIDSSSKSGIHALVASYLGESFDAMDATIYFIAMYPALQELLNTKDTIAIGWHCSLILATFMVGWSLGSIIFGMIADRIGRSKTMMLTILLYAGASALCAVCQTWWQLGICRFLVGLGIGGEIAVGCAVVGEFYKGNSRLWAMSIVQTSFGAGCLLSGLFNLFTSSLGWRFLFLVGIIPAFVVFYIRAKMKEPPEFQELSAKRAELRKKEMDFPLTVEEKHILNPPLSTIFNKEHNFNLIMTTLIAGVAIVGYWACISWIPAWINQITGLAAVQERSEATIYMSVGGIIGTMMTPFLIAKFAYKKAFQLTFIGSLVPTFILFAFVHEYSFLIVNSFSFIIGFTCSIPFAILCLYCNAMFPTQILCTASGIAWSIGRIFAAIAGLCTGPLIAAFGGSYGNAAACISLVYLVGLVASFIAKEPAKDCH